MFQLSGVYCKMMAFEALFEAGRCFSISQVPLELVGGIQYNLLELTPKLLKLQP